MVFKEKRLDITLTEINALGDWLALRHIRVKPQQRRFVTNLVVSWLQSRHPAVTSYGIDWQGNRIGYVMLIHAENPTQWIIERLTIDGGHQRQGLGYAAADKLIDMVYNFENSEMIIARYHPDNDDARRLFQRLKFEEREEMFRGRNIALLEFEFEEQASADEEEDTDEEQDDGLPKPKKLQ